MLANINQSGDDGCSFVATVTVWKLKRYITRNLTKSGRALKTRYIQPCISFLCVRAEYRIQREYEWAFCECHSNLGQFSCSFFSIYIRTYTRWNIINLYLSFETNALFSVLLKMVRTGTFFLWLCCIIPFFGWLMLNRTNLSILYLKCNLVIAMSASFLYFMIGMGNCFRNDTSSFIFYGFLNKAEIPVESWAMICYAMLCYVVLFIQKY